jgi:hypothetical protein
MNSRFSTGIADDPMKDTSLKDIHFVCLVASLIGLTALFAVVATRQSRSNERFISPGVLLIEDRLQTAVVFDDDTYDHYILHNFLPIAENKVVLEGDDTNNAYADAARVHCVNISKYEPRGKWLLACTDDVVMPMFITTAMFDDERDLVYLSGKRVGIVNDTDVSILAKLLFCHRMHISQVDLVRIDITKITQADISLGTDFDCIFVMLNPSDPARYGLRHQKVNIYSYRAIDVDRAKKTFPCAQIVQRDVKQLFPRLIAKRRVETFLEFRNVVYIKTKEMPNYTIDFVIKYFDNNMGMLNFFERYYALHPRTRTFQREFNDDLLIDKREFAVLEQFEPDDPRLEIKPTKNVPGYLIPSESTFYTEAAKIEGVPLIVGDLVSLSKQDKADEDGEYEVTYVGDDGVNATRMTRRDPKYPVVIDTHDDTHYCVTNPSIKHKHECLNPYDRFGNRKSAVDVWDGPCKTDLQCPFYHYDKNEKGYKGGCVNGMCQMPMGYTRVGFTKYVNR